MSDRREPADEPGTPAVEPSGSLVLTPAAASRVVGLGGGTLAALVGLVVLVVGPGDFDDSLLGRLVFGGVLILGGALAAVRSRTRLELDDRGVTLARGTSSSSLVWAEVTRIEVEERFDARARAFGGSTESAGPLRVRSGAGPSRRKGVSLGSRSNARTVLATIHHADGSLQAALAGRTLEEVGPRIEGIVSALAPQVPVAADGA